VHFMALRFLYVSTAHLLWLVTGSKLSPMILQLRLLNSSSSPAI
jgi:hypothetical protein